MADFLIRKSGYYYRPNTQGYTASVHEAGRYPEAEAVAHMMACDPGEITIFPAPVVAASIDVASDIRTTAEQIAIEHVGSGAVDMDGLATAIAAALETERARAHGSPARQSNLSLTIAALQRAHVERQEEWCPDQKPDLSFRGNELGGECGEAQNVIKKLERERHGWRGSRDTVEHLAEELADVIHCAVLVAITAGIKIEPAVIAKFNNTSQKNGLTTFLATTEGSAG